MVVHGHNACTTSKRQALHMYVHCSVAVPSHRPEPPGLLLLKSKRDISQPGAAHLIVHPVY